MIHFYAGGIMLMLPWFWIDLNFYADGGIHIDVFNPNEIHGWMGPCLIATFNFLPTVFATPWWTCPRNPRQWLWEFGYWRRSLLRRFA